MTIPTERSTNWRHALLMLALMSAGSGCLVLGAVMFPSARGGFFLLGFVVCVALIALHSGAGEMLPEPQSVVTQAPCRSCWDVVPVGELSQGVCPACRTHQSGEAA